MFRRLGTLAATTRLRRTICELSCTDFRRDADLEPSRWWRALHPSDDFRGRS
jgi:hypothetical protein